jgi:hypothetical protein
VLAVNVTFCERDDTTELYCQYSASSAVLMSMNTDIECVMFCMLRLRYAAEGRVAPMALQ